MASLVVVEDVDVLVNDGRSRFAVEEVGVVNELGLDGRKEALRHGVVPAVTLSAHAPADAGCCKRLAVIVAGVLASPIRVVNHPFGWPTGPQRHRKGVEGKLRREAVARRPADDSAGKEIQKRGEVEPALPRPDVGDVRDPGDVGGTDLEVAGELVRCDREIVSGIRGGSETPLSARLQAFESHQPRHAISADGLAVDPKPRAHAGGSVGCAAAPVDRRDLCRHSGVRLVRRRRWASSPSVETTSGDLENAARDHDPVVGLLHEYESKLHLLSFAKKAAAFFRISLSSRSTRLSRRSCVSSCFSAEVSSPLSPAPASIPACRTHSRTAVSVRSRSLATRLVDRSPARHSCTTSALNSFVNDRLFLDTALPIGDSWRILAPAGMSTKRGEAHNSLGSPGKSPDSRSQRSTIVPQSYSASTPRRPLWPSRSRRDASADRRSIALARAAGFSGSTASPHSCSTSSSAALAFDRTGQGGWVLRLDCFAALMLDEQLGRLAGPRVNHRHPAGERGKNLR